jgi:UDP-glucose 4-epimerase
LAEPGPRGGRALITGANGFIGSRLIEKLKGAGVELHAFSRTHPPGEEAGVRWWRGDIGDAKAVADVFASVEPEIVVNLAGVTRAARDLDLVRPTFDTNLLGTINVLTGAAQTGCRRVVLAGSLEEPDAASDVASSPYAAAKWASTVYGRMFHELYELPVVILRVFMVYGPGQREVQKLIPYTILALLRGEQPRFTGGTREIDWIYVDDVAAAFSAAAFAERVDGTAIDIGSGQLRSVRDVVERITELVAPAIVPLFGAVEERSSERVRVADTEEALSRLGWRAATAFDHGLAQTVEWFRRRFDAGAYGTLC